MRLLLSIAALSVAVCIGGAALSMNPSQGQVAHQNMMSTGEPRIKLDLRASTRSPCRDLFRKPGEFVEVTCSAKGRANARGKFDLEALACADPSLEPLMSACLRVYDVRKDVQGPSPFCLEIIYDEEMATFIPLPPGADLLHSVGIMNTSCDDPASEN